MTLTLATPTALDAVLSQFEAEQAALREIGSAAMEQFIYNGLRYYNFKALLEERNQLLIVQGKELDYSSFHAWIATPENKVGSPSSVHRAVQTIDVFHMYFAIPLDSLLEVGVSKFSMLNVEMEIWISRVKAGKRTWAEGRAQALWWIIEAKTNSVTALEARLKELTIRYTGDGDKNEPAPPNESHTGGYEVLLPTRAFTAKFLRAMPHEDLLGVLGVTGQPDDQPIFLQSATTKRG